MKMRKESLLPILVIVGLLLATLVLSGLRSSVTYAFVTSKELNVKEGSVIKIGVINPLTGKMSYFGQAQKKGFDLALEEINDAAVEERKIELIYEDTTRPDHVSKAAQKLITIDKVVAIIGSYCPTFSDEIAPIAEGKKIILMVHSY